MQSATDKLKLFTTHKTLTVYIFLLTVYFLCLLLVASRRWPEGRSAGHTDRPILQPSTSAAPRCHPALCPAPHGPCPNGDAKHRFAAPVSGFTDFPTLHVMFVAVLKLHCTAPPRWNINLGTSQSSDRHNQIQKYF